MIGSRPTVWWRICLQILTPLFILVITGAAQSTQIVNYTRVATLQLEYSKLSVSVIIPLPVIDSGHFVIFVN